MSRGGRIFIGLFVENVCEFVSIGELSVDSGGIMCVIL